MPTGYHKAARESAETISEGVKREIAELSAILSDHDINDSSVNIIFLEKLSNSNLIKWIQSQVGQHCKPIHALYCMAHVLLGFHKYSLEQLTKLQSDVIVKENIKFGRDANNQFSFFKSENSASRIIRMVSEAYGPNGDERNGICDKWIVDCHRRDEQSYISDYRDNRFNSIFRGAAELIIPF